MYLPVRSRAASGWGRVLLVLIVTAWVVWWTSLRERLSVATFNIENFPKSDAQISGAFETIEQLDVPVVGVQEIRKPALFATAAREHLGARWRFVRPDADIRHVPGVLYDRSWLRVVATETHDETRLYDGARPVFEADFRQVGAEGVDLEVFVLHLKAGDEGLPLRSRQHRALRDIVRRESTSAATTVVLGDFNSTRRADRRLLERLAGATDIRWLSRGIACTGYWKPDRRCRGTTLDHVLGAGIAGRARPMGPCRSVGCEPGRSCPRYVRRVSDHCPVVAQVTVD